jgi:hypothetical protein
MSDDIPPFPGKPLGNGYYEVTEEEMKDWVLFRPELPDPDGDTGELPHERVKKSTTFSLLDIIIFFDWASTSPVDDSGCNQWAFVVDENQALYIRGKVRSVPLGDVHKLDNATVIHRIPEALGKLLAPILLKYKNNPMMFQIVINHMQCNNFVPIIFDEFTSRCKICDQRRVRGCMAANGRLTRTKRFDFYVQSQKLCQQDYRHLYAWTVQSLRCPRRRWRNFRDRYFRHTDGAHRYLQR